MTNTQTRDDAGKYAEKRKIGKAEKLAKRLWLMTGVIVVAIVLLGIGQASSIKVTNEVEAETKTLKVEDAPVMQRIAKCESKNSQVGKSGQLQINVNTNGTVDIGRYEINSVWFAQATKLGFDLSTEQGNHDMAMWIYQNKGTGAWASSANCWNK